MLNYFQPCKWPCKWNAKILFKITQLSKLLREIINLHNYIGNNILYLFILKDLAILNIMCL